MSNSKWTTDSYTTGWMGHDLIKVHLIKDGILWDTVYYVPCIARSYGNIGSARKAISMFIKRGGC